MFKIIESKTLPLTRDVATQFASMTPSHTERTFLPKRLKMLEDRYQSGLFVSCHWACVSLGGVLYRMNGQHSSQMLAKLPDPFPQHLFVHLDTFEAETREDMALLFRQFDTRDSARTPLDISQAYQHTYPELAGIAPKICKMGADGIAWYLRVVVGAPAGIGDEHYTLYRQPVHYPFLHWLPDVLTIKTPELRKNEVIAAMYATDLANRPASHDFWEEVARGGKPYEEIYPTSVLDTWLKSCKDGTCEDTMKQAYHYQGCLFAWNAWREGKNIKSIQFSTSKGLITPHA